MTDNVQPANKKLKIDNKKNYNENTNVKNTNNKNTYNNINYDNTISIDKNLKSFKNKKINFCQMILYQQINYKNNKYIKKIKNNYADKYNEYKKKSNYDYCIEDHTYKYYPFVNNGTCRFCLKKKPKTEKEILDESYKELFK